MDTKANVLAAAFGRRLVEGRDEWRGVSDVVRSSLLLLHGELRRQEAARREELHLLREELRLVREQLQLSQDALRMATATPMPVAPVCGCERQLRKLQARVERARATQREWQELVVRAAEQQQRQLQRVEKQVDHVIHDGSDSVTRAAKEEEKEEEKRAETGRESEEDAVVGNEEARSMGGASTREQHAREDAHGSGIEPRGDAQPTRPACAHASLRRRYHRERERQLRRLDRLRRVPLPSSDG